MYLAKMLRSVEAKVNYELLALFVRESSCSSLELTIHSSFGE
jgi:hypothetical protein